MKNALITIIYADLKYFKDNATGKYDKEMTEIHYLINMTSNERHLGPSHLICFKSGNLFETLKPYLQKPIQATIEEKATENGSKYVITKLADKELK